MSQPADGASFAQGATVALAATAGDTDGTVSRVEFYAGQTKLGEDTTRALPAELDKRGHRAATN